MSPESISSIFSSILESGRQENKQALAPFLDQAEIQSAIGAIGQRHLDRFFFALPYPLSKFVTAVIDHAAGSHQEAKFLLSHREFVNSHVRALIEKYEGGACSADKVRTILNSALRFYLDGKPIEFNYEGETTYHLPKVIFKEQDAILRFLKALEHLYYGSPERYLVELMAIGNLAVHQ